jgi:hypothetical protein
MAITNDEGFSSLDALGPEYGKINQPNLDTKGLSAFEGDRLEMPKIKFPEPEKFFPVSPNSDALTSGQRNVRTTIVGSAPNKPGINKNTFDYNNFATALKNKNRAEIQTNQDKSSYAKVYSYDAGPDGNAFYKRYAAYGQETFDKIGFSPLRDNEALFNSRTNWWDDHKRMMTNSFWPLFGRGFVSGPKSLGRMLSGDFTGTSIEDAEFYKETAAIGQSSKGGLGAFTNNTIMNFGYSAGIMSEAILEEIGGILLAPETLGGSFVVTTANLLKNTKRAFKGLDLASDGYKAVNGTLKSIDNVSGARNFWQKANGLATSQFSPVANTFKALDRAKKADNLTNLGKGFKTFGGFYRDVQRMNMALSEARLEGGMVKNEVYDKLYNQYYAKNGKAPSNEEQYELIKQSEKASLNTVLWNTTLIYASNAITFPNIMGPKGGVRNFMKGSIEEFQTIKGGKFGDLGKIVYDKAAKNFSFEKNNFKNMAKTWLKQPGYKAVKGTLGYFKSNFAEGVQENLQEVIAGANERYYIDSFNSPVLKAHEYAKGVSKYNVASQADYFGQELGNQFTAQGFETFASGFAMGALAVPVNATFENLVVGYNKVFDKETYQNFKNEKLKVTKEIVQNLNSIDINDFLNAKPFNYATQDAVATLKQNGSKKEATDADLEGFMSQMDTVLQTGTMDVFREKLNDLGQLSAQELEDAIPTIPKGEGEKYLAKIPTIIDKTKKVEKRYDYYKEKFPNPVNTDNLPAKDSPEYQDSVALYHAWNKGIQNAVYFNEAFEDTISRKNLIMQRYLSQAPLKNMSQRDSEIIFDYNKLRTEQAMLKEEVASLEQLTDPESKKQLGLKKRKLEAIQELGDSTLKFTNFYNRYEKTEQIRKLLQEEKGDVPVTDEEIELVMDQSFGEFTEENKINMYSQHESAYKNYLKSLANLSGDYLFDQDIDESYVLLADHYKLDSESRGLLKYVNLLHDPNGFLESVDRTRTWMKDLYKKRGQVYEKMVKEQLNLVIDNALLNALANKGVYISIENFVEWKNNGTPPTEFFDNARKIIIPEGTEEYDMYHILFEQAAELKDQQSSTVPESLDTQLQADLDNADKARDAEIANLPKKNVKAPVQTIVPDKGDSITLAKIANELNPGEYADADYGADQPFTVYKDFENNLRLDNEEGEIIQKPSASNVDFTKADVYTVSEQPDPELAKPIIEKYETLKNKIIEDYNTNTEKLIKAESEPIAEFVLVTPDVDSISNYPILYNSLYAAFQEKVLKKMSEEEFVNLLDDQEVNLFNKFLQTNKEARIEIDNFNKNQKLEEVTRETGEKSEFDFIYQGNKKNTSDYKTVLDLRKMQRRFKALVDEINAMENPATEDITKRSRYKILITDFEKLIATRSKKGFTPELLKAINLIEGYKEQKNIQITEEGISIDGIVYKTVSDELNIAKAEGPYKQYIDDQIKNLFDATKSPTYDATKITQEAFDNLFGTKGYLTALKQRVDNGEISIVAQDLVVYDSTKGIASVLDLVVADTKGNLTIVSVQPDSKSNWDVFKKQDNPKSKMKDMTSLLSTEADLLQGMINQAPKIAILPIEMSVSEEDNKIISAGKPSSPSLLATDFLVSLTKAPSTVTPVSDIKTKEADIEARKQKELFLTENKLFANVNLGQNPTEALLKKQKEIDEFNKDIQEKRDKIIARYDLEIKKAKIERKVNNLPDNLLFITHITSDGNAVKIFNDNLLMPAGVSSTTGIVNKEQLKELLFDLAEGKSPHRGYLDLFIGAIDKTTLEKVNGKNLQDKLENYLDESYIEDVAKTQLPSELNIGYFTNGVLNTKYDSKVVPADAESSDDVDSPAQTVQPSNRLFDVIDDSVRYTVNDFKNDLLKINSKEALSELVVQLGIKTSQGVIAYEDLQEIAALSREKSDQLNTPEEVKIIGESLVPEQQFIAKNTIFTEPGNKKSKIFAQQNDTVVIDSINRANKTVTVSALGSSTKLTLGFNELDKLFMLKDIVMGTTKEKDQTITPEDKVKIIESTDLADTFIGSSTKLDKVEGEVSTKTPDESDNELLKDLEC